MAIGGSELVLAELVEFAGADLDDAWMARAFALRLTKANDAEECAVRLRIFKRMQSAAEAVRIDETAVMALELEDATRVGTHLSAADLEVALALGIGSRSAANKIASAMDLIKLPMTMARMRQGRITEWHALTLLKLSDVAFNNGDHGDYGLDLLARCEPAIYQGMCDEPLVQQLRSKARRKMIAADPIAFNQAHEKATKEQDVTIHRDEFRGMAEVTAQMSLVDAETLMSAVRAYAAARRIGGDDRPAGALKVAALLEWAELFLTGANTPRAHGRPVELSVIAPLATVLGLSDAAGEIPGIGPIPADEIRRLAADAKTRLLTIDGNTGRLLDCGRATYRPPVGLADAVIAANPVSIGPFADIPAQRSDLDHNKPWDSGGETNFDNLAPLDRRIHRAKTLAKWHYEIDDDTGGITWTSGLGQHITIEPYDYDFMMSIITEIEPTEAELEVSAGSWSTLAAASA